MAFVSVGSNANTLTELLDDFGVEKLSEIDPDTLQNKEIVKVFVNGNWYGIHREADQLFKDIKDMRRSYTIPKEISIFRDLSTKELKFFTDSGRVQRPLFIVENNELLLKKHHVLKLIKGEMNFESTLE